MDSQYAEIIQTILDLGQPSSPRGMPVVEIHNAHFVLEDPTKHIVRRKPMQTRKKYAEKEFEWYVSGSNLVADMGEFAHVWKQYSDDGIHVNSAYGQFMFLPGSVPNTDMSQWEWVKRKLRQDPDTRQAIININQPIHKFHTDPNGTKDFPCCVCMYFYIRGSRLYLHTQFRSQDVNTGLRNDVYTMAKLQMKMADELSIELGSFTNSAFNLHLYMKDYDMAVEYVEAVFG